MTSDASLALGHLLRDLAPQVLGAVTRRHGDFADAEDAVQDALLAAATQWPVTGVPDNPRGWLYHVAMRRLLDQARSDISRREREQSVVRDAPDTTSPAENMSTDLSTDGDDTLLLLFMCCHPSLTSASAIALTLRAVGGLTTREIASAFLVPEATMAQRISRAKQLIKASEVPFAEPGVADHAARLQSVLHVLYLIFNEGYASAEGTEFVRTDLSNEAIRLVRALYRSHADLPEIGGLLALMLLTDARRAARTGTNGELIPLDEQDRSKWDQRGIREGVALVSSALAQGRVGPYQVQAAIAAIHDEAPDVLGTDWPQVLAFYDLLARMQDNPMVRLNRAVAFAMVHGPVAGLRELDSMDADPRLASQHRLAAVKAHLYERAGDTTAALTHYQTAAERATSTAERNYLLMKAARLTESRASGPSVHAH